MQEATETPGSHLETEQAALLAVYSAARRWQTCLQQTLSADNLLAGQPKDVTVDDYHRRSHSTDPPVVSFRDTYYRRVRAPCSPVAHIRCRNYKARQQASVRADPTCWICETRVRWTGCPGSLAHVARMRHNVDVLSNKLEDATFSGRRRNANPYRSGPQASYQ